MTTNKIRSATAIYMNIDTGSVGEYDDWDYENEDGETVNAVELGEVVEVTWNGDINDWEEVK